MTTMKSKMRSAVGVFFSALLAVAPAAAEVTSSFELRGQAIRGDHGSSKFQEYEDMHEGVFLEELNLGITEGACYMDLSVERPGLSDQRLTVDTGRWGRHKFTFDYNETPHIYSTTGRSFFDNAGNGFFELPDNLQNSLQSLNTNAQGFMDSAPSIDLRVDRRRAAMNYAFNPAGKWRFRAGYASEKKTGQKVIGVSFGHSAVTEAPEPVDYMTHDITLGTEYVGESLGMSMGYHGSLFENGIDALTIDNPFRTTNTAATITSNQIRSTPGRAQLALAPDNSAHSLNLGLNYKTTRSSRLALNTSYTIQRQNETFLPLTINEQITNHASFTPFAEQSLDGKINILNAAARWNWEATRKLKVNLKAKWYAFMNKTPRYVMSGGYVTYDSNAPAFAPTTTINSSMARATMPLGYDKKGVSADVNYELLKSLGLKLGWEFERMDREYRETNVSKENTWTAALNWLPGETLQFRPSYQYGLRRFDHYSAHHVEELGFPVGEGTGAVTGQLSGLRKYDQADRKRQKAALRADWTPTQTFNLGLDAGQDRRDYFNTSYGQLESRSLYTTVDFGVRPTPNLALYADATYERVRSKTRSRYRTPSGGGSDLQSDDWEGLLQDVTKTVNLGADVKLGKKWGTDLGWSYVASRGIQDNWHPGGSGVISTASALAEELPPTSYFLNKIHGEVRYQWLENLLAKLHYEFQKYDQRDWAQDDLAVYQSQWNNSIFLGATQGDYKAHLVWLGLTYQY